MPEHCQNSRHCPLERRTKKDNSNMLEAIMMTRKKHLRKAGISEKQKGETHKVFILIGKIDARFQFGNIEQGLPSVKSSKTVIGTVDSHKKDGRA